MHLQIRIIVNSVNIFIPELESTVRAARIFPFIECLVFERGETGLPHHLLRIIIAAFIQRAVSEQSHAAQAVVCGVGHPAGCQGILIEIFVGLGIFELDAELHRRKGVVHLEGNRLGEVRPGLGVHFLV